ncbi:MAG: hypothetical protein L6W00_18655 [Lentisphaeria bacterium]|nr:MAG: hypothetical protein L6W00_18655 [Lentisphaeria bacterium]
MGNPKLWYPAGYGEQPLYPLTVTADGMTLSKRIGLRDMQTVSEKDEYGVCLKFRVNGIDVFAKGADWIPMDSRPETYTRDRYDALLSDAVEANMNCLRVWGGGLYENEDFYDLCDEKGILIWQDMMLACAVYPDSDNFLALIRKEVIHQVKRLRDHACIALWCGDNECAQFVPREHENVRKVVCYDRVNQAIRHAVFAADRTRVFWPTSPATRRMTSPIKTPTHRAICTTGGSGTAAGASTPTTRSRRASARSSAIRPSPARTRSISTSAKTAATSPAR